MKIRSSMWSFVFIGSSNEVIKFNDFLILLVRATHFSMASITFSRFNENIKIETLKVTAKTTTSFDDEWNEVKKQNENFFLFLRHRND